MREVEAIEGKVLVLYDYIMHELSVLTVHITIHFFRAVRVAE